MITIVIQVPDNTPDLIRRYGTDGRLEIGGIFGTVIPVRIIEGSGRPEQDRR